MKKDDLVYVGHMLDMARLICRKMAGTSRHEYEQDENLRFALVHLLQTIGEAARRVSPAFQQAHSEIPWSKIVGMRHKVVHDYLEVEFDTVWDVATMNVPLLVTQLEKIVPPDAPSAAE